MFLAETFFSRIQPDRTPQTVDFDVFRVSPPSPCWTPTNSITCFRRTTLVSISSPPHAHLLDPVQTLERVLLRTIRGRAAITGDYWGGGGGNVVRNDVKRSFVIFSLRPDGLVGRIVTRARSHGRSSAGTLHADKRRTVTDKTPVEWGKPEEAEKYGWAARCILAPEPARQRTTNFFYRS